ncbi:purine phosphorylase,ankyrin repeat protein [Megavirus baoshan]|uniref:Purine phosphorylase,ankyrin repeat protein n=1 Tax=Megavirus baoshan TaxID=2496520 RepID=A0A3S8UY01_9VIRU|nr:purine phosphorylase,ankyrin repeat protein [Megavirus baoshan]AZL89598.1 purine phosphorylase,ankyrin repeat protein [Megavirus baoshan]
MEIDNFNSNIEYRCCPDIKCKGFTELMYLVTHYQKIDNYEEKIINWLYHNEYKINATNELGWSALMLACCNSNIKIIKLLLDFFADPNIQNNNLDTALILACQNININDNVKTIELLLKYNIDENNYIYLVQKAFRTYDINLLNLVSSPKTDLNKQNIKGETAFITIIKYADNENVKTGIKLLLDNGANINNVDKNLESALHIAVQKYNDDLTLIKILLENGINVNLQNKNGMTALVQYLYTDTKSFEYDPELVKLLLEYGTDPNIYGKYHNLVANPLFIFYGRRLDDLEMINLLLDKGVDINSSGPNKSLLSCVISYYVQSHTRKKGDINIIYQIIILLLERGADTNIIENDGLFPLFLLIKKFHKFDFRDLIIKLIKYGADINLSNSKKKTILSHLIRKKRDISLIEFLLKLKPNMNHQNYLSNTYLMIAIMSRNQELIKLLIEYGSDVNYINNSMENCLFMVIKYGCDISIIKLLIEYGANVNFSSYEMSILAKALHIKSVNGPEIVGLLLKNGADPNYFYKGRTALIDIFFYANNNSNKNNIDNIQNLFKFGADPNILDIKNNNALLFAIKNRFSLEVINLLIAKGTNIHITNNENKTALMYAIENIIIDCEYCHQVVNLLLDHGINANITDLNGQTALIIASDFINKSDIKIVSSYLFDNNGILTRLMERTNYSVMDNYGKTVLSYLRKDITLNFIKLFEKVCVKKSIITNIHQSILDKYLTIIMSPSSIRTRLLTIYFYHNQNYTYQQILDLDKSLLDYFGINDKESFEKKLLENIKNI